MKVESFVREVGFAEEYRCVRITADRHATPFYLSIDCGTATSAHNWYYNFDLAVERYRGLSVREASA